MVLPSPLAGEGAGASPAGEGFSSPSSESDPSPASRRLRSAGLFGTLSRKGRGKRFLALSPCGRGWRGFASRVRGKAHLTRILTPHPAAKRGDPLPLVRGNPGFPLQPSPGERAKTKAFTPPAAPVQTSPPDAGRRTPPPCGDTLRPPRAAVGERLVPCNIAASPRALLRGAGRVHPRFCRRGGPGLRHARLTAI